MVEWQPIFSLLYKYPITATFDGTRAGTMGGSSETFLANTVFLEFGLQNGSAVANILLPERWEWNDKTNTSTPINPWYYMFTAKAKALPNIWNNLSLTWSPGAGLTSNLTMYANGQSLDISSVGTGSNPVEGLSLATGSFMYGAVSCNAAIGGPRDSGPGRQFCNVRFWTPARTQGEVVADPQPFGTSNKDLVALKALGLANYWSCSEGQGTILTDLVGGCNGTVVDPRWLVTQSDQ